MASGFAVCGENPASVSRFAAKIRHRPTPAGFFALSLGTNTAAYIWSANWRLAAALAAMSQILASPRGASSEVNLGSRMRRLIAGLVLCLLDIPVRAEDCVASLYVVGDSSQPGTKTASGIPLNDNAMTAAHKALPFGSKVRVINKKNGHAVTVTITDRGLYVKGRCIEHHHAGRDGNARLRPYHAKVRRLPRGVPGRRDIVLFRLSNRARSTTLTGASPANPRAPAPALDSRLRRWNRSPSSRRVEAATTIVPGSAKA